MTEEIVEWRDPPPKRPRRVDQVAAALRERPKEWARIDRLTGLQFVPWWSTLANDSDFEVKIILTTSQAFGPRDIYARFTGKES